MTSKSETPASGPKKPPPEAKAATDPEELLVSLAAMNDAAEAQGFSLGQVLAWAAHAAYGINIAPPPAEAPQGPAPADD